MEEILHSREIALTKTNVEKSQGLNKHLTNELLSSNDGDIIDLPEVTDEQLESEWVKTDLSTKHELV